MDEPHLVAAVMYVSMNPVRAGLVARAEDWPWSSTRAHLAGQNDALMHVAPVLERVGNLRAFLDQDRDDEELVARVRRAEQPSRPVGSEASLKQMEARSHRTQSLQRRGPKPKMGGIERGQGVFGAV